MIDSHCHLDFDAYDGRRDAVIDEAERAGVHTLITIGVDLDSSRRAVQIAEKHTSVYATVGIHPHDARTFDDETVTELRELSESEKVVGIGEIGLDYYRDLSPRPVQERVFRRQLELAAELRLPVVIHTRNAFAETVAIVREYAGRLAGGVFHCFPGDARDAGTVCDLGFVVSVGGTITYRNSRMARMAAKVPLDRMIMETDSPFLTPEPYRGKPNQPAYVSFVCEKLAELQNVSRTEVARVTDRVCRKLFRLGETFEG
ncbi:MAG TPA: TatD family hydrolase [Acidobacteriota bacterium]|nr:TatD family hydrolase [Acidobacteriota bacterium]